jgi:hypothetical protein
LLKSTYLYPKIKRAVDECCDDEILVLEHDLQSLRRVGRMFAKLLSTELPAGHRLPWDMVWRFIFGLGRVMVCIDLSLRKHGFGKDIDSLLSEVVARVQAAFDLKFNSAEVKSASAA